MKKLRLLFVGFVFMIALSMASCENKIECEQNEHTWIDATCTEAKHCKTCGKVEGVALEHSWIDATCTEAKHCKTCGKEEGATLEHSWMDATCLSSEKCSACGYVRNQQLGEHKMVEATYLHAAYCEVCNEQFGDRLVCDPVSLEAQWSIEGHFLTSEQYQNFDKYVKVYGILENGEKVELSNEDIKFERSPLSDSKCMSLFYRDVECTTDKVLLPQLLEVIPFDFNQLEWMLYLPADCFAMVDIYVDSLRDYLNKAGYINYSDYLTSCGFSQSGITKMYAVTGNFVPIQYYNKGVYCICFEPMVNIATGRPVQTVYVYKMPEKFVTMGLDLLLSNNIYNLYYRVKESNHCYIGDSKNPILSIEGKTTAVALQYFSEKEKNQLIDNINQFYNQDYKTYQEGTTTYYHFTGNEQYDIVIEINPTADGYVDINFSLIEMA